MKSFIWSCVAFFTLFGAVQSLKCYTCDASILGFCTLSQPINCTGKENNCYSGRVSLTGMVEQIHSKGCIDSSLCKNITTPLFNNTNVQQSITMTCCSKNLCNRAGPGLTPLSLSALIGVLLTAVGVNFSL